jgi:hypothetical protein
MIIFTEPRAYGTWLNGCGVTLLVTSNAVSVKPLYNINIEVNIFFQGTWKQAMRYCSKIGMSVLTIYNEEKQGCLYDILSKRFVCANKKHTH